MLVNYKLEYACKTGVYVEYWIDENFLYKAFFPEHLEYNLPMTMTKEPHE